MKTRIWLMFVAFVLVCLLVLDAPHPAGAKQKFIIGYSQFWGTIPFSTTMINGARKAIDDWKAKGVEVELIVTDGGLSDITRQVADVEDLYAQGINGLILFPGDSEILAEPIKSIYNKKNIPVVVTDIGLKSGEYIHLNITNNYLGGQMAAELVAKNVDKGSKVIVFNSSPGVWGCQERERGFITRSKELGLQIEPRKTLKVSLEEGRKLMEDTLVAIPDISAVFFTNTNPAKGAYTGLEGAGRTDVKLVPFDLDKAAWNMVKEGKILGCVVQDPYMMGYEGINAMLTYLTGGSPKKELLIPPKLLTRENADKFADDPQVTGM